MSNWYRMDETEIDKNDIMENSCVFHLFHVLL